MVNVPGATIATCSLRGGGLKSATVHAVSDVQGTPSKVAEPVPLAIEMYEFTLLYRLFTNEKVSPGNAVKEVGVNDTNEGAEAS